MYNIHLDQHNTQTILTLILINSQIYLISQYNNNSQILTNKINIAIIIIVKILMILMII
jgi:hypothetical protein